MYSYTTEIQKHESELSALVEDGIVGERPNPLPDKSDENKWNKRDYLQKQLNEKRGKIDSHRQTNNEIETLRRKQTNIIGERNTNYKNKHQNIVESQQETMNKAINSMRKDLNKKKKYPEQFVFLI